MDSQLSLLAGFVAGANSIEDLTRPMLRLIQQLTGLESTYLTSINFPAGVQRIEYVLNAGKLQLPESLEVPWYDTLCKRALESGRFITSDVAATWPDSAAAKALGLQTYMSVPVVDAVGEVCGTLCGASSQQLGLQDRPELLQILQLCAELISVQWARDRQQQSILLRASRAERELSTVKLLAAVSDFAVAAQSLPLAVEQVADLMRQSGQWQHIFTFSAGAEQQRLWQETAPAAELESWLSLADLSVTGSNIQVLPGATCPPQFSGSYSSLLNIYDAQGVVAGLLVISANDHLTGELQLMLSGIGNTLSLLATRLQEHQQLSDLNEQLTYHARHDALTGLPNRRYLLEELERLIARGNRQQLGFYLIFVDLDKFKQINDQFGHETGDEFLRQVGQRLSECLRKGDFVARQGGGEFVMLCQAQEISKEQAQLLVNRIRQTCSGVYSLGTHKVLYHGPSIGTVSWHSGDSRELDLLLSLADVAMYQDKQRRRAMPAPQLLN